MIRLSALARGAWIVALSSVMTAAPALRAQDDDMPDGDVDIVEKPKKKAAPKGERRAEKAGEKKEEERGESPHDEKPRPEIPPAGDSDDIPNASADDVPPRPEKAKSSEKARATEPFGSGDARNASGDAGGANPDVHPATGRTGPAATASEEDLGEATRGAKHPLLPTASPEARRRPFAIDDAARGPSALAPDEQRASAAGDEEPPAVDDSGMPWLIGGAAAGGLLLLTGAGVGGYFLVDALIPKTGSVTVTPR